MKFKSIFSPLFGILVVGLLSMAQVGERADNQQSLLSRIFTGLQFRQAPSATSAPTPQPKSSFWTMNTNNMHTFVYPPSLGDVNNNGILDIVASSLQSVYVWNRNGALLTGWPYVISPPLNLIFPPSLADINSDGKLEIFGGAEGDKQFGFSNTGSFLPGWPQQIVGQKFKGHSAIGDVDGNGDLEIVAGTNDPSTITLAKVYVWNHDGSILPGWPQSIQGIRVEGVALADLDNNADLEVAAIDSNRKVFIWNHNGNSYSTSWPLIPQPESQALSCPPYSGTYANDLLALAIGDVDNSGSPDVVVATYNYALYDPCKRIWVHAFNSNGAELPNFPVEITGLYGEKRPGIALADLDNDSLLEIIIPTTKQLVVVKPNGTFSGIPQNFPATFGQVFGAVVANIDGDPEMEIIAPMHLDNTPGSRDDGWGQLYAWNHDGTMISNFPINMPNPLVLGMIPTSMLSIADLDGDGRPEVVGGYGIYTSTSGLDPVDTGIYVQKLPGGYPLGRVEWGTYAHDVQHTNSIR